MARTPSKLRGGGGGRGGRLEKKSADLDSEGECAMGDQFFNMLERGQYALRS